MARQTRLSKWVDSNGSIELLRRWDLGGNDRVILAAEIGYLSNGSGNSTGLYNQLCEEGYLGNGSVRVRSEKTDTPKTETVKTVRRIAEPDMPQRVIFATAAILALDVFELEEPIGYPEFKAAMSLENGKAWLNTMLLGKMKEKEKGEFNTWLAFHQEREQQAEQAAKQAAEKAVWRPMVAAVKAAQSAGMTALVESVMVAMAANGYEFQGYPDNYGNLIPTFE